ncbi:MAG: ATP-dependent RecD-like DNA helicase [Eubacterium sp.]|nr:ATP-dependent RecD-like DNA helicase [Eubacterium sp.]
MVREGYIVKVIWHEEYNGYSVLALETTDGEETIVGYFGNVYEGMYVRAEGEYVHHPQYDLQFSVRSYEVSVPTDTDGIERFLGSGMIKGIGKVMAKRIVNHFKEDTLRIISMEPERLAEIRGISMKKAREYGQSYQENREFEEVIIRLSQYGIQPNTAIKIYSVYGKNTYSVITTNPYRLAEDVSGVGFRRADEIARAVGIPPESEFRMQSALLFVLNEAMGEGNIFLPKQVLLERCYGELMPGEPRETYFQKLDDQLVEMAMNRKVEIKILAPEDNPEDPEHVAVYTKWNYQSEKESAALLTDLKLRHEIPEEELDEAINAVEKELDIRLDPVQKQAVRASICSGVAVITGGPGTGKTTIISALIRYFENNGMDVMLAAPTGRAAKRITESTGVEARTIHRLLEFSGDPDPESGRKSYFARNETNPLECDAVIIDEASMLDQFLFHSLLKAISSGTRLILVGDVDQLPSVGAGNVLHDIIASRCFPVTTLSTIFRQSGDSRIIENAHKIKNGELIPLDNKNADFFMIPRVGSEAVIGEICTLLTKNLPQYLGISTDEIQVLTPMRKRELGVEGLNKRLQMTLNPGRPDKAERRMGDVVFREGDKVMQTKNNYKQEWRIPASQENDFIQEEGIGVFNGDMGHITRINTFDEVVEITFDDGRESEYSFSQLDELEHAFAVTVHKSQGSEYPAVVIPLYDGPPRLLNRNLFYTAVTRAKRMVVLVGDMQQVGRMIRNVNDQKRYTSLKARLEELHGV